MSQAISFKLEQLRRKKAWVSATIGAATACTFAVVYLALEMLLDWSVDWPFADGAGFAWMVRAALLAVLLAALGWIVLNRIIRPIVYGHDEEDLALAVERLEPDLRGRLIATVQLSRPDAGAAASPALVRALIEQTERMSDGKDFTRVVPVEQAYKSAAGGAMAVLVALILFAVFLPNSATLLGRALLSTEPVPRKTRVEVKTGDTVLPRGDSVTIVATAHGIRPPAGELDVFPQGGQQITFTLDRTGDDYVRKIDNVVTPFDYRVKLNDGRSAMFHVRVVERPVPVQVDFTQVFPAYIALPETHRQVGDLSLVTGSRLVVSVRANKPLQPTTPMQFPFNHIHLSGSEVDYPLKVDDTDPTQAGTIDDQGRGIALPPGTSGLSIWLVDTDGLSTKNPTVYHVELAADNPPKIRIVQPTNKEQMVTHTATVRVDFDATDDYGLGRLSLRYSVDSGAVQEIVIPMQGHPPAVSDHFDLSVADLNLPPPKSPDDRPSVQFWLYAEDLNTLSSPDHQAGHSESDKFTLRLVTDEEKRRELMSRFEHLTSDQLNAVANQQRDDTGKLGQAILQGVAPPATQP